jgi:hypothetical protein
MYVDVESGIISKADADADADAGVSVGADVDDDLGERADVELDAIPVGNMHFNGCQKGCGCISCGFYLVVFEKVHWLGIVNEFALILWIESS